MDNTDPTAPSATRQWAADLYAVVGWDSPSETPRLASAILYTDRETAARAAEPHGRAVAHVTVIEDDAWDLPDEEDE